MYEEPNFNFKELKNIKDKFLKALQNRVIWGVVSAVIILVVAGVCTWTFFPKYFDSQVKSFLEPIENWLKKTENQKIAQSQNVQPDTYVSLVSYEQAIIDAVKKANPSVVSIIISKDMPVYEQYYTNPFGDMQDPFGFFGNDFNFQIPQLRQKGTQKQEVGGGSGFLVSEDGLILTNKHVVSDKQAEYTVLTNDAKKYSAKVLALDPAQDLAIIKISNADGTKFTPLTLGDSSGIQIGQGVIAIGNALGEFRNTVSVGIVSGLSRTISAFGSAGFSETLEDIIQTDAAINPGNSGGPLLNLRGEVIGINTAVAQGAQSIGFTIPINRAKRDIEQVKKTNKISYPFLGVRYILVNSDVKEKYNLSVDYGALVLKGDKGEPAVTSGSAAEKAGLKEKDLILETNGQKITQDNSMAKIISNYNPGDKITLKVLRDGKEINIDVVLGERN